jgi:hypothetical protein
MKTVILLLGMIVTCLSVKSQLVARSISDFYPASIVIRVYDVSSKNGISEAKQLELAKFFSKSDSLVNSLIISGITSDKIASTQQLFQTEFHRILSGKATNDYYNEKFQSKSRREADVVAKILQQKYHCDSSLTKAMREAYFKKRQAIEKFFQTSSKDSGIDMQRISELVTKYDSVIDKITYAASSNTYIKSQIEMLDHFKPLGQQKAANLEKTFIALCAKNNNKSFADNFSEALQRNVSDTSYYSFLNVEDIQKRAVSGMLQANKEFKKNYKLSKNAMTALSPLIYEKEWRLATLNYAYPYFTKTKDSLVNSITVRIDSLIAVILNDDGVMLPTSQFAIAVRNSSTLGLSEEQKALLRKKALELKKMKDDYLEKEPFGKYDSKAFETNSMLQIISEEQYYKVLNIKNQSQAKTEADQDWIELNQRNLAAGLNKDSTIRQLRTYYLAKWTAYYRHGNDKIKQAANVKAVQEHMPAYLRALTAARKYNNPVNTDASSSYRW